MGKHLVPPSVSTDDERLGALAMMFRGTWDRAKRQAIVKEYATTVKRLIESCRWNEMPAPEDQLPDEYMPKEFFQFWFRRQGTP